MVHLGNGILLSHKKETMPFAATWMELEIIILSKVSQKQKDKYHMISLTCGILKKKRYKRTYLQKRNRLTDFKNEVTVTKGDRWWGGMDWGFGMGVCTLLYVEWMVYGYLLCIYQIFCHNLHGKRIWEKWIRVYVSPTLFAVEQKWLQPCKSTILQ